MTRNMIVLAIFGSKDAKAKGHRLSDFAETSFTSDSVQGRERKDLVGHRI